MAEARHAQVHKHYLTHAVRVCPKEVERQPCPSAFCLQPLPLLKARAGKSRPRLELEVRADAANCHPTPPAGRRTEEEPCFHRPTEVHPRPTRCSLQAADKPFHAQAPAYGEEALFPSLMTNRDRPITPLLDQTHRLTQGQHPLVHKQGRKAGALPCCSRLPSGIERCSASGPRGSL